MWRDTLLLLDVYWRIGRAERSRMSWFARLGVVVAVLVFGAGAALVGYAFGRAVHLPFADGMIGEGLMPGILLSLVQFGMFFLGFAYALNALFLIGDMGRLMVAPLDTRAIFTAKLLGGYPSLTAYLMVIALPALIGYGVGAGMGPGYFVVGVLLLLFSPLSGIALGALISLVVVRIFPVKRLREYLNAFLILFGMLMALVFQIPALLNRNGDAFSEDTFANAGQMLERFENAPVPSMWAGRGLAELGTGAVVAALPSILTYMLLTVGLFALTAVLAHRLYATGWLRLQGASSDKKGLEDATEPGLIGGRSFTIALFVKDWLLRLRDSRLVATILGQAVSAAVLIFLFVLSPNSGDGFFTFADQLGRSGFALAAVFSPGVMASGMVVMAGVLIFSQTAGTSLALERKSLHVLKMAPVNSSEIVRGKMLGAIIPYGVLTVILFVIAWFFYRFSLLWAPYGLLCALLIGSGALAFHTAMGFPWVDLDWEDPRRMGRGRGGVFGFFGSIGFGLLASAAAAVPFALAAAEVAPAVFLGLGGLGGVLLITWLFTRWSIGIAARAFPKAGEPK